MRNLFNVPQNCLFHIYLFSFLCKNYKAVLRAASERTTSESSCCKQNIVKKSYHFVKRMLFKHLRPVTLYTQRLILLYFVFTVFFIDRSNIQTCMSVFQEKFYVAITSPENFETNRAKGFEFSFGIFIRMFLSRETILVFMFFCYSWISVKVAKLKKLLFLMFLYIPFILEWFLCSFIVLSGVSSIKSSLWFTFWFSDILIQILNNVSF